MDERSKEKDAGEKEPGVLEVQGRIGARAAFERAATDRSDRFLLISILAASLLLHAAFFTALSLLDREPQVEAKPREIPVEVIVEKTQPKSPEKPAAAKQAQPQAPQPPQTQAQAAQEQAQGNKPSPEKEKEAVKEKPPAPPQASPPEQRAAETKPPTKPPEPQGQQPAKAEVPTKEKPSPKSAAKEAEAKQNAGKQNTVKQNAAKPNAAKPAPPRAGAAPSGQGGSATSAGGFDGLSGDKARSALPFDLGPPIFHAVTVPLPVEGGDEPINYKVIVFGMLEAAKHFPEAAAARGARGVSAVEFSVDDAGAVLNVTLLHSSGDPDLDEESLALVRRAAPFPAPPPGAQHMFAAEITFGAPP